MRIEKNTINKLLSR